MTSLFDPLVLRGLTIRNRIILPPMAQYQCLARDGLVTDWHLVHYGARAAGGFGLLIAEATAVVPEGRITPECAGLWTDAQRDAWAGVVEFAHAQGAAMAVQLGHSGRKGSAWSDLSGQTGTAPAADGGWQPVAPSAIAFPGLAVPRALAREELPGVVQAFADAARRADQADFDAVEVHAAHGYLLSEFLSPLTNLREDEYGGGYDGRTRLLLEVVDAIRAVLPDGKALIVRVSATEWLPDGWGLDDTVRLAALLGDRGVDLIDVSSGGNVPASITLGPGYQVPLARAVRAAGVPVTAVGLICEPEHAQAILTEGSADAVEIGRAALREPSWPLRAARDLRVDAAALYPPSYRRGRYPTL